MADRPSCGCGAQDAFDHAPKCSGRPTLPPPAVLLRMCSEARQRAAARLRNPQDRELLELEAGTLWLAALLVEGDLRALRWWLPKETLDRLGSADD